MPLSLHLKLHETCFDVFDSCIVAIILNLFKSISYVLFGTNVSLDGSPIVLQLLSDLSKLTIKRWRWSP